MPIDSAMPRRPSYNPLPDDQSAGEKLNMKKYQHQTSSLSRKYPSEYDNNIYNNEKGFLLQERQQQQQQQCSGSCNCGSGKSQAYQPEETLTLSQQLQRQMKEERFNLQQADGTHGRRTSLKVQSGTDSASDFLKGYQNTRSKITAMGVLEAYNEGVRHHQANDIDQAIRYYEYAAKRGHPKAQHNLGSMYENGTIVSKDDETAVNFFKLAAEKGIAESQFSLAMHYKEGTGCPKDIKKTIHYLEKAADTGHAKSCFNLGLLYEKGVHVEPDPQKALICYTEAAARGNSKACVNLGLIYSEGRGVKTDLARAVRYFAQAADKGDATGIFNLSLSYQHGVGVEKNPKKAMKFLEEASEANHPKAQFNLAKAYLSGEGVEGGKNEHKARELLMQSANAGEGKASRALQIVTERKNKPPPKADLSHFGVAGGTSKNSNPVPIEEMYTTQTHAKDTISNIGAASVKEDQDQPPRMRRIIGRPTEEAIARAKAASERRRSSDFTNTNGAIAIAGQLKRPGSREHNSERTMITTGSSLNHHRRISSDYGFDNSGFSNFDGNIHSRTNSKGGTVLSTIPEPEALGSDTIYRRRSSVWVDLNSEEDVLRKKAKEMADLREMGVISDDVSSSGSDFVHS